MVHRSGEARTRAESTVPGLTARVADRAGVAYSSTTGVTRLAAGPWEPRRMADPILPETYWRRYVLMFRGNREQRLAARELDWADDEVRDALGEPVKAVGLLVRLADAAPDDQALAYLGAGPIEDLLVDPAPAVVDEIERAARRNKHFRYALRSAWFDDQVSPAVRIRLRRFGAPP
ncbi:MAG: hypothetical protein M3256_13230 [Actinomycetota bacterium]|nr:hypothetical protein [Actinomycetota bacterium]